MNLTKASELFDSQESSIDFDYDAVDDAMKAENVGKKINALSKSEIIKLVVKELLYLRLKNSIEFDYIAIKIVYPGLKYEDIIKAMRGGVFNKTETIEPRLIGRHRARIAEIDDKIKRLFPGF